MFEQLVQMQKNNESVVSASTNRSVTMNSCFSSKENGGGGKKKFETMQKISVVTVFICTLPKKHFRQIKIPSKVFLVWS